MNVALSPGYISLCSGIGGLDLALARALPGARCVCYVERELTAAAVLAARVADGALDDAPVWSDLNTFDPQPWRPSASGVTGGIPCQPFSTAGKRRAGADIRDLWPRALDIVGELGPAWCFFENVPGMANKSVDWYYFRSVRPRLQAMGFAVEEGFFTAAEVGAPHERQRLFILAHRDGAIGSLLEWQTWPVAPRSGSELVDRDSARRPPSGAGLRQPAAPQPAARGRAVADAHDGAGSPQQRVEQGERPGGPGDGGTGLGDANEPGLKAGRFAGPSRLAVAGRDVPIWPPGSCRLWKDGLTHNPGECSACDGWAAVYAVRPDLAPAAVEPAVRGVADGLPRGLARTDKLRLLGNAVVPATAELALRTLIAQAARGGYE